jgi:hypothetical protein
LAFFSSLYEQKRRSVLLRLLPFLLQVLKVFIYGVKPEFEPSFVFDKQLLFRSRHGLIGNERSPKAMSAAESTPQSKSQAWAIRDGILSEAASQASSCRLSVSHRSCSVSSGHPHHLFELLTYVIYPSNYILFATYVNNSLKKFDLDYFE